MAVVKMSRLRLIGLRAEQNKIINTLMRSGLFEVIPTKEIRGGVKNRNFSHLDRLVAKQAKVAFAINFLSSISLEMVAALEKNTRDIKRGEAVQPIEFDYTPPKSPKSRQIIGYDDFYDVAAKEYELLDICESLENISFSKLEIKSKITKLENINRNLAPYENSPIQFSQIGDTRYTFVLMAVGPVVANANSLADLPIYEESFPSDKGLLRVIVGKKADKEKVTALLAEQGFAICPYRYELTAQELLSENKQEIVVLNKRAFNLTGVGLSYEKYLPELKVLYDVLNQEIEKSTAEKDFVLTRDTFVMEGWIPTECADAVLEKVKTKTGQIFTNLTEAKAEDNPPSLLKNPKIIQPYEDVTNMYSVPAYGESDPNPFMAVFFFIFFGIMLGDAGYGIVLAVVCGLAVKFMRFEKGAKRLLLLVGMGGISAIVWGLLFGGVFSIQGIPALWFNPMEDPIMMLAVSLILGVIQIMFAYALHAARLFKEHKPLDAILDTVFIYILFGGIGCLAVHLLLSPATQTLFYVGLGLLFGALAGIALTNGRHKKGIINKILGGVSGLYGIVNLASDVLSYARLFGLGLASGAIGLAFNTLAGMLFGIPAVGYVVGFILLIPLHAFNIGIGVLGAYVHNARLQFLEFYGKFYEGGGSLFSPMGEKTKYVRFA